MINLVGPKSKIHIGSGGVLITKGWIVNFFFLGGGDRGQTKPILEGGQTLCGAFL